MEKHNVLFAFLSEWRLKAVLCLWVPSSDQLFASLFQASVRYLNWPENNRSVHGFATVFIPYCEPFSVFFWDQRRSVLIFLLSLSSLRRITYLLPIDDGSEGGALTLGTRGEGVIYTSAIGFSLCSDPVYSLAKGLDICNYVCISVFDSREHFLITFGTWKELPVNISLLILTSLSSLFLLFVYHYFYHHHCPTKFLHSCHFRLLSFMLGRKWVDVLRFMWIVVIVN